MDAALTLDKTQHEIENEYYLVDLPELIEKKRRLDAQETLRQMQLIVATNRRALEDEDYSRYRNDLLREAGVKHEEKFDRNKFEQLRALTEKGANKA